MANPNKHKNLASRARRGPHSEFKHPVLFVGAGPGDPELITVKGQKALAAADVVIYTGSLVPEAVLKWTRAQTERINSASQHLEQIIAEIENAHAAGKRVAVWGGGSKCVSFLTTNGLGEEVAQVIDINPFKQGKYLPGTGHPVSAPDSLQEAPPDTVIVMNPVYLSEIGAQLSAMGLTPELVAV